uniref:Uncharacterized protein n=1 Tax=Setaria viridis TaxID=4556 RepID=A0A4U6VN41_SETVI|nr:hypothetical protein SEVIR_2G012600v2 [Setaria viridis]
MRNQTKLTKQRDYLTEASDAPQGQGQEPSALAVWNPITGEQHQLPLLKRRRQLHSWNAAVLCGTAAGACDHVDCHRGPFRVVFVSIDAKQIFSHVYSSESSALREKATTAPLQDDQLDLERPPFRAPQGAKILKCDATTGEMFMIRLPAERPAYGPRIMLTTTKDGELGFIEACRLTGLLWVWSVELGPVENAGRWVSNGQLYTLDLKSGQVAKIPMTSGGFYDVVPYVSFYTPVLRAALAASGEGTSAGASTSA